MEGALNLKGREDWRRWLGKNGGKEREVWLVISKKGAKSPGMSLEEAVDEAVCYGWIDGRLKSNDGGSFLLRFSPRKKGSLWSEINRARALRLIRSGRMKEAGMEKIREAMKNGRWAAAYSSRRKQTLPRDFKEALSEDGGALKKFNSMSNSHRLSYIFWIENAKKDETRRRRIEKAVEMINSKK